MEPVTELLGLQVLLSQVLKVTLAVGMSSSANNNLVASSITSNSDGLTEVSGLSVNLETVMEEVLKGSDVEDGIGGRASAVDGELGVLGNLVLLWGDKGKRGMVNIYSPTRIWMDDT